MYNGVNEIYPRDALNRMQYMDVVKGTTLAHEGYTSYNAMNRITLVDYGTGIPSDSFGYYLDGELKTATVGNPSHTLTYNLDNKGNRTSVVDTANPTTTYSPNTIDQYTSVTGNSISNGPEHEISDYQGVHYAYINDERLKSVMSGSTTYSLFYDALGRCVKRSITGGPTTYYIYDGEKPILEYEFGGVSAGVNVYGKGIDEILERVAIGSDGQTWYTYFPQQNHEGSVTLLTDATANANVLERYRYDAFGAPTFYDGNWGSRTATIYDNRFLFTGREYAATYRSTYTNAAFNFYEYRARAYNPKLGRFMSEDPKLFDAGDYNLFRYCHNDPVDLTDPMGTEPPVGLTSPRQMSQWIAEIREGQKQLAQLQAYVHAMEWSGHGAIAIGGANFQIGQVQTQISNLGNQIRDAFNYAVNGNTQARPFAVQRTQLAGEHSAKEGNKYVAYVPLKLTLVDKRRQATLGRGIYVAESIDEARTNTVNYAGGATYTHNGWTDATGSVKDGWKIPFSAPTGQATSLQHIIVNGQEAIWSGTVHMNYPAAPTFEGEYWAEFK